MAKSRKRSPICHIIKTSFCIGFKVEETELIKKTENLTVKKKYIYFLASYNWPKKMS